LKKSTKKSQKIKAKIIVKHTLNNQNNLLVYTNYIIFIISSV